jgi:hypothetical protein
MMLSEVIMGTLARKFGEILVYNQHAEFECRSASNWNSTPPGSPHASRLLSHRVRLSHITGTSHTASTTLAGPMRKLSPHAGPANRSPLTTFRTPTSPPATTQTLRTSCTSGRSLSSLNLRSTRLKNRCQARLPALL